MPTILRTPRILARDPAPAAGEPRDPLDLDAAREAGAFTGLAARSATSAPTGTIATVAASGLRGRGGAGFPTAEKWRVAATPPCRRRRRGHGSGDRRSAAASSSPTATAPTRRPQTDRTLLERNPYGVLEGVADRRRRDRRRRGDRRGPVRGDRRDPGARDRHRAAERGGHRRRRRPRLRARRSSSRSGPSRAPTCSARRRSSSRPSRASAASPSSARRSPRRAACSASRRSSRTSRPSPPSRGSSPTAPRRSPRSARRPARARSSSRSGRRPAAGVAEVPIGTPLQDILALAGKESDRNLKAILVGGPSGGILPAGFADTPYEFEALRAVGAHVGSGSIVAADKRACIVDLARLLTRYCADEACGKTIPCRIGLRRVSEIGDRIATGVPKPTDVYLLADLSADIVGSALCDHERLATLPFASGMRYFRSELDEHILRSSCPAGVCRPIAVAAGAAAH